MHLKSMPLLILRIEMLQPSISAIKLAVNGLRNLVNAIDSGILIEATTSLHISKNIRKLISLNNLIPLFP